jgi:hypothetical protein
MKSADHPTPWALMLGLVTPPNRDGKPKPVPHSLYGSPTLTTTPKSRTVRRMARMDAEVAYLREHGPFTVVELAELFGISTDAMSIDIKALEDRGKVRLRPHQWEAV